MSEFHGVDVMSNPIKELPPKQAWPQQSLHAPTQSAQIENAPQDTHQAATESHGIVLKRDNILVSMQTLASVHAPIAPGRSQPKLLTQQSVDATERVQSVVP